MLLLFFIFTNLEVALELAGLNSLVRGFCGGATSFFDNFLSYRSSLMLVGMLVWPTNQKGLSLVGESTS
jgi:hypothetical protein